MRASRYCVDGVRFDKDLRGKKFNRLTVVRPFANGGKGIGCIWELKCDCGKTIYKNSGEFVTGGTKSCGCYHREQASKMMSKPKDVSGINYLLYSYRASAKKRGYIFELDRETFKELLTQECYYCGIEPMQKFSNYGKWGGNFLYNGIDRVDNSVGYVPGNVVTCCTICNYAKRTMSVDEFLAWVSRVYHRHVEV